MSLLLLVANLALAGYLTGLIWMVQAVHYPLFVEVGDAAFARYHAAHLSAIGRVVMAPMLAEAALALWLVADHPARLPAAVAWASAVLVGVAWADTFFLAVPLHDLLVARGYDRARISRLVAANWIRTIAWSARLALLSYGVWLVAA